MGVLKGVASLIAIVTAACATLNAPRFLNVAMDRDRALSVSEFQRRRAPILEAAWQAICAIPDRECIGSESYAIVVFVREKSCDISVAVNPRDSLVARAKTKNPILLAAELSCDADLHVTVDSYN